MVSGDATGTRAVEMDMSEGAECNAETDCSTLSSISIEMPNCAVTVESSIMSPPTSIAPPFFPPTLKTAEGLSFEIMPKSVHGFPGQSKWIVAP